MEINKLVEASKVVLKISGRLDTTTAPELEKSIKDIQAEADSIVLDFAELEYISSAGLRVLLSTHKEMSKKQGLFVSNVSGEVMEIFEITGFADVLNFQ